MVALNRFATRVRSVDPVRVALVTLALPLLVLGWLAGRTWVALVWARAAILVGFDTGSRRREGER